MTDWMILFCKTSHYLTNPLNRKIKKQGNQQ
jgi:hypothetical protein